MTPRAQRVYSTPRHEPGPRREGWSADALEEGYYRIRRNAGSVWRPIAIWFGPPHDPETGELMDRHWRWQIMFCGRMIWDETLVWPYCKSQPIDRAEYDYLIARLRHADLHDPRDPYAHPTGRVDWLTSTPTF